jgi:hypothetical protein
MVWEHRGAAVPEFRCYVINRDGHIVGQPTTADCDDDRAAVELAMQRFSGQDVEVWQLDRKVIRLVSGGNDLH